MDDVGRDYVVIALALGDLEEGIVDAYYGPPELREQAFARGAPAAQLAADAVALRARVRSAGLEEQRQLWLDRQLMALETIARRIAGEELSYLEEVERCFDAAPEPTPPEAYAKLRRELDDLLPRGGTLHERLEARDARLTIPVQHVKEILDWLVTEIRALSAQFFPAPEGESLSVSLVTNQPWSAYNWYDGELRSRIEVNTDLPTRANSLVGLLTHETFPGHHLEHSWKEQRLVRERGLVEASIQLINTPEAYISEGLAEVGGNLLVERERWQALMLSTCERAGIALSAADSEREWLVNEALRALRGSGGDAALQLHAAGRSRDDVRRFLVNDALRSPAQAEKTLEFISHPLWRTYVFCYGGGLELLTRWCAKAGDLAAQRERFSRLLTEQLTPSGIQAELMSA